MRIAGERDKLPYDVIVMNNLGGGMSVHVDRMPLPGETVKGYDWKPNIDSGKGPNSCICMSRLGLRTAFLGIAGADAAGDRGERWMREAGVDTSALLRTADWPTGQGIRIIDSSGQNMIICGESVSHALKEKDICSQLRRLAPSEFFMTGFEISEKLTFLGLREASALGMRTVLNYSPVMSPLILPVPDTDYLIVNESEAAAIANEKDCRGQLPEQGKEILCRIQMMTGCRNIIMTVGSAGGACLEESKFSFWKAPRVKVIDTTGAGDAFASAMVFRLVRGDSLTDACRWASVYASYTVTRVGTIPAYPDLEQFLASDVAQQNHLEGKIR